MLNLKNPKKVVFFGVLVVLLCRMTLAWAGLKAGVVLPLSGRDAFQGQALKDWLEEVKFRFTPSINLVFYDSEGKCGRLQKIVDQAYWDEVDVLIGPLNPSCVPELLKEARLLAIPAIITSGEFHPVKEIGKPLGPYFRTGLSSRAAVKALYSCLRKGKIKKIGLLLTQDAVGREGEKWLLSYALEYGLQIEGKRYFGVHDTNISYHVEAFLGCEAVICWAPPETAARVAESLAAQNFGLPVYFPHFVAKEAFLRDHAGLYGRPFVGAAFLAGRGPFPPKIRRFYERWRKETEVLRDPAFAAYTDALLFLREGLRRNRRRWLKGLEKAGLVKGLTGLYFLSTDDHYGLIPGSVGVFRYRWFKYVPVCRPGNKIF